VSIAIAGAVIGLHMRHMLWSSQWSVVGLF
jgi:hypothetical protein